MKKSVEILGLPIISITEGRELGISKSLLIDAENGKVAALTIEDEDWYRGVKLIPYESIIAIGEDAITITHSDNILNLDEAGDYERLLGENIRVIGTKAISKNGRIQGKITEVFIGEDGQINQCEITAPDGSTNIVTDDQVSIFGKEVTVVDIDDTEKKNSLTAAPPFEPAPKIEPPVEISEPEPKIEPPVEISEPEPKIEPPVEISEPEPKIEPPVEISEPEPKIEPPVEISEPEPKIEPPAEISEPEPKIEPPAEISEPEPKVKPAKKSEPTADAAKLAEEEQKIASMTQQAEDLKAALQRARAGKRKAAETQPTPQPQLSQKKQVEKAVDERRRRVLIGKHATKTIIAESGTIIVESGAEITEDVLQRARLANKFIELSMNVQ